MLSVVNRLRHHPRGPALARALDEVHCAMDIPHEAADLDLDQYATVLGTRFLPTPQCTPRRRAAGPGGRRYAVALDRQEVDGLRPLPRPALRRPRALAGPRDWARAA